MLVTQPFAVVVVVAFAFAQQTLLNKDKNI